MTKINWTRINRHAAWVGSIDGATTFVEREAFIINKVKPSSAPHTMWAATVHRRAGKEWNYEYVVAHRVKTGVVEVVGRYPTIDAAKAAA